MNHSYYAASSFRLRCANAPYELKRALITNLMRSKLLKNTLLVQLLDKHSTNAVLLVVYLHIDKHSTNAVLLYISITPKVLCVR